MALLRDNITKLQSIAQITPFATNLFELEYFGRDNTTGDAALGYQFPDADLYCQKIVLSGEQFSLDFDDPNPYSFENYLGKSGKPVTGKAMNSVTITWREHRDLRVWNYHRSWMNRWYSQRNDMFATGPEGKKRNASIVIKRPHALMSFSDIQTNAFSGQLEEDNHTIQLIGMVPTKLPSFPTLSHSTTAENISHDIVYKVDRVIYAPVLNNAVDSREAGLKDAYSIDQAWKFAAIGQTDDLETMVDNTRII